MATHPKPGVLIIDDDELVLCSLARALRTLANVTIESSPQAALERIRSGQRFGLVLCDVMMPQMTGPELFENAVAFAPGVREVFVFVSGGMNGEVRARLEATGRPWLLKPVTVEHLRVFLDPL